MVPKWPVLADVKEMLQRDGANLRGSLYLDIPERPSFDDLRALRTKYYSAASALAQRMKALGAGNEEVERIAEQLASVDLQANAAPATRGSLAVFADEHGVQAFALARLNGDGGYVGRSYHLRTLLAEIHLNQPFRVLAVSPHRVRLFEGDARALSEVPAEGVPKSIDEAFAPTQRERSVQYHSTHSGGSRPVFHGEGGLTDARAAEIDHFHHVLANALIHAWRGRADPLVLVADKSHLGRFRKAAGKLPGLLEDAVDHHPDGMNEHELHALAWPLVHAHIRESDRGALQLVRDGVAHGGTIAGLAGASTAALAGRVERLWFESLARAARHVDAQTGELVDTFGDEDALDELAGIVVARGGKVVVASPGELASVAPVLAELRG